MKHTLTVTLIANEGVVLDYRGTRLLLDGLHRGAGSASFSPPPPPLLKMMLSGSGAFSDIDYLLFSHYHIDHMSTQQSMEYVRNNRVRGMFLPDDPNPKIDALRQVLREQHVHIYDMRLAPGEQRTERLTDSIGVTYFNIKHAGFQYEDDPHYCFLIDLDGMNFLFTGDAGYDHQNFNRILADIPIKAAFVNLLFIINGHGRRIIAKSFQPEQLVLYHLPFAHLDGNHLRTAAQEAVEKYGDTLPPVQFLRDPLQQLTFEI